MAVRVLETMAGSPPGDAPGWSPRLVATACGEEINKPAYHVRQLKDRGLVREVGTRRVRGAIETFYRVAA